MRLKLRTEALYAVMPYPSFESITAMTDRSAHVSHLTLLFVGLFLFASAQAQDCPFTESDAIADTLNPKGYYPLEINIVHEYVNRSGPFIDYLLSSTLSLCGIGQRAG
ncbi:hypothetical protein GQ464_013305 [Rhodocaloribacter litoris]|uniref:hypothetical protein n=1 Tax=Rhodocaloribacter litoris TaxID=2558931 RepID=UPI001422300E|nr:hypothetical protein [Rhodocaloribacter litoris]QXD14409.1 hypothetical protein GQ464_013305 [Rhodocaloribacter litoris]